MAYNVVPIHTYVTYMIILTYKLITLTFKTKDIYMKHTCFYFMSFYRTGNHINIE